MVSSKEKEENSHSNLELKPYIIFTYDLKNLKPVKKIEVSHKLYGHAQTKNGKRYEWSSSNKSYKKY